MTWPLAVLLLLQAASPAPPARQPDGTQLSYYSVPPDETSAAQAAQLEERLAANPEDEATRGRLLHYYWENHLQEPRVRLIWWLIDNRPASPLLGYITAAIFRNDRLNRPGDLEGTRNRWRRQLEKYPEDPGVVGNAARALGQDSMRKRVDLMRRAQKLDPQYRTTPLAELYSMVLWTNAALGARSGPGYPEPGLAAEIRSELLNSREAAFVGAVARRVVEQASREALEKIPNRDFPALRSISTELLSHAQALEPDNRDWSDFMEGVKGLPAAPAPPQASPPKKAPAQDEAVLGGAAQKAIEAPAPAYPREARAAGIQGVVKLQVRISKEGSVMEATVLSGHPLLVPAALEAVKRYRYQPLTIEGKPYEVLTTVEVPFRLETP